MDEGLAKFLLEVKDKIDDWEHMLAGEIKTEDGKWSSDGDEKVSVIMMKEARKKYISTMREFCSRIFTMSYYPEYNDIMRIVREFRCDIGDFLAMNHLKGEINCDYSFLVILRDKPTRMVESCLLYALQGGMRNSLRQTMKTSEVIRRGDKGGSESKFKLF